MVKPGAACLSDVAEILLNDTHDLINKAVGGWVREAGERAQATLLGFLDHHAATMPRTALRCAIAKLTPVQRKNFLGLRQTS